MHTKQDVPKQQKKILPTSRERTGEVIPATWCEWGKQILEQNMGMERSQQKSQINKQAGKRVANAQRRP